MVTESEQFADAELMQGLSTANNYFQQNNYPQALQLYLDLWQVQSNNLGLANRIAECYMLLQQNDAAREWLAKILAQDTHNWLARINLAIVNSVDDYDQAIKELWQVFTYTPKEKVLRVLVKFFMRHGDIKNVAKVVSLHNQYLLPAANYLQIGKFFIDVRAYMYALRSLELALQQQFTAESCYYIALCLVHYKRAEEAIEYLQAGLELASEHQQIIEFTLACAYQMINAYPQAVKHFNNIMPAIQQEATSRLNLEKLIKYYLLLAETCDFERIAALRELIIPKLDTVLQTEAAINIHPGNIAMHFKGCCDIQQLTKKYVSNRLQGLPQLPRANISQKLQKKQVYNIGFISQDFFYNPISLLFQDGFKLFDRSKYKIFSYYNNNIDDQYVTAFKENSDKFVTVYGKPAVHAAEKIKQDNLDILIDLSMFTACDNIQILAYQPAKVQAHMLGYIGSSQAECYQYFITQENTLTTKQQQEFSEKVINIPSTGLGPRLSVAPTKSRQDYGLPKDAFVFGLFNSPGKVSAKCFEIWFKILDLVPNSVVWLLEDNPIATNNIRKLAAKHGIAAERLIFSANEIVTRTWYVAHADLLLDSFIISRGTLCYLALQAGVPFLTYRDEYTMQTTASYFLQPLGLTELITNDIDEYIQRTVRIATDKSYYHMLTTKINCKLQDSKLFSLPAVIAALQLAIDQIIKSETTLQLA